MIARAVLLASLACALFLTGLSWFLQLVQFPLLEKINAAELPAFVALQRRRNTLLMAPVMALELVTSAWLGLATPETLSHRDMFHAFLPVAIIWMITFLKHVPLHRRLLISGDPAILGEIQRWNWVRTLCWTGRSIFLLFVVAVC